MIYLGIAVFVIALAELGIILHFNDENDKLYSKISRLVTVEAEHQKEIDELKDELAKSNAAVIARFDSLPLEEIEKSNEFEKAWNKGLSNILNYGSDMMKQSKEGDTVG